MYSEAGLLPPTALEIQYLLIDARRPMTRAEIEEASPRSRQGVTMGINKLIREHQAHWDTTTLARRTVGPDDLLHLGPSPGSGRAGAA